jgi:sensor c-di-GMP phosphodiesterase-like protein
MSSVPSLLDIVKVLAPVILATIAGVWALFKWFSSRADKFTTFLNQRFTELTSSVDSVKKEMQETRVMHMAAVKDIEYLKDDHKETKERVSLVEKRVDKISDHFYKTK